MPAGTNAWLSILQQAARWMLLIVSIAAVSLLLMLFAGVFHKKVETGTTSEIKIPEDSLLLTVEEVSRPRYETAIGAIKPVHEANVASKILARVEEVNVTAGQHVKVGEVLVRLSDEELQTQFRQAEAELDSRRAQQQLASVDFERAKTLVASRSISQAEYEAALAQLQTTAANVNLAQRALDEAQVYLDFATITAPFTGIIVDKAVQPGDTVSPGETLVTMYDPTQMQLVANVRESLAMKLQVGQKVPARLESLGYDCYATVSEVVPKADVNSRSFEVKVTGPCPPGVYIGMFGRLMIPLDDEKLLLIPKQSIQRVGQLTMVQVAGENRLKKRVVQLGRTIDNQCEVLSGLEPGEQILAVNVERGGDEQ